ncbi:ribbon-helix-helix domain-containing protein [Halomonas titanicae]|uniref:ribbon-helix-helix domain-containing protein n=1 Tax=Vreelandella titanicae TaxID=664683 RepID=UPI001F226AE9|nr:ribbon-helix-helix domain-containing protein [Halomonas titanicae]MCE7520536.1 ribbon-helix-helix domain-containing protein [Halomonas titanicae]
MSHNPRRFMAPIRLIVNVEADTVARIDALMKQGRQHGHHNRAEFVRRAVERELARCQSDDFPTR